MADYEEFLSRLQPMQKGLKDSAAAVTRLQKTLQKNTESGNLAEVGKALASLSEEIERLSALSAELSREYTAFDVPSYFAGGDFSRQLLDCCGEKGIDVRGEKGVYEMFPYKVRVLGDAEHPAEVWMDRKKIPSARPAYVAGLIEAGQKKLYSVAFKPAPFMNDLAEAYDTACKKSGARFGSNQPLTKIYKLMVPLSRSRKEYDAQAFAFDLARLYDAGTQSWVDKNGVQYAFGTSRDGSSGIRVLSRAGTESYISTLRPLNGDAES
ncbi:MAG: hypothetical protein IJ617_08910 [Oscillospiraceae bacterium]|nr:hypothetical protein [Oscillospiraceae bacterium]